MIKQLVIILFLGFALVGHAHAGKRELMPLTSTFLSYLISLEEAGKKGLWKKDAARTYEKKLRKIFDTRKIKKRLAAAKGASSTDQLEQGAFKKAVENYQNALAHADGTMPPERLLPLWKALRAVKNFDINNGRLWAPFLRTALLLPVCTAQNVYQFILFSPLFDAAVRFSIGADLKVNQIGLATGDTLRGAESEDNLPLWARDKQQHFSVRIGLHGTKTINHYSDMSDKRGCDSFKNKESADRIIFNRVFDIAANSTAEITDSDFMVMESFLENAQKADFSSYLLPQSLELFLSQLNDPVRSLLKNIYYLGSIHTKDGYIHIFAIPNIPLMNFMLVQNNLSEKESLFLSLNYSVQEK